MCGLRSALATGHPLVLRAGSYGSVTIASGDRTLSAYPGEAPRLENVVVSGGASYLGVSGLRLRSLRVTEGGSHHVALRDSVLRNHTGDAVLLEPGTSDVLIAGNRISTTGGGNGITLNSSSCAHGAPACARERPIRRVAIRDNRLVGIGVDAIRPANFDDLLVERNEITGVVESGDHSDALQVVWGGRRLVFRRNLVHDNRGEGLFIKDGRVRDVTVEGNGFVRNRSGYQLQTYDTIGLRVVANTFWDNELTAVLRRGLRRAVLRDNIFDDLQLENDEPDRALPGQIDQDRNLVAGGWNWGARGRHDIERRPRFAAPRRLDYRLVRGSAGRGMGAWAEGPPGPRMLDSGPWRPAEP
jgi:hypothetical protein